MFMMRNGLLGSIVPNGPVDAGPMVPRRPTQGWGHVHI